ncbi:hypothetical protein AAFF_G00289220 [Aldrovandia affinis]|uniref:Uncharacterized protein n=1 Tax=Aldrovandia affinis TaxID=143900 RepID=A0AAD7RAC3_9TELE|nr:hypothetical protein AAFF_G00289220 [Aldrovandia affinis]
MIRSELQFNRRPNKQDCSCLQEFDLFSLHPWPDAKGRASQQSARQQAPDCQPAPANRRPTLHLRRANGLGQGRGPLSPRGHKYPGPAENKRHQFYEPQPVKVSPVQSAAMKFSLIAALLVVLALAHGSESVSVVKREAPDLEKLTKYFQDLSETLTRTTQEIVEKLKNHELTGQAHAYIEEGKAQLTPLTERIQEQLTPLTESMQAQIKPLADSVQTQLQEIWKMIVDQAKAVAPAQ